MSETDDFVQFVNTVRTCNNYVLLNFCLNIWIIFKIKYLQSNTVVFSIFFTFIPFTNLL